VRLDLDIAIFRVIHSVFVWFVSSNASGGMLLPSPLLNWTKFGKWQCTCILSRIGRGSLLFECDLYFKRLAFDLWFSQRDALWYVCVSKPWVVIQRSNFRFSADDSGMLCWYINTCVIGLFRWSESGFWCGSLGVSLCCLNQLLQLQPRTHWQSSSKTLFA
jgi:hypothetical protein